MKSRVVAIFLMVILVGCNPQKRLARLLDRYPLPTDTTIEYRDTTLYDSVLVEVIIPGEVVVDSILVPVIIDLPEMTLTKSLTMAEATAWIRDNQLGLELIQYDSLYQVWADSVPHEIDSIFVEVIREIPVEIKPNLFWKHGFLVLAGLILIGLSLFFLLKRK